MKRIIRVILIVCTLCIVLYGCDTKKEESKMLTKEMAYDGVNKYCHDNYDWSVSEDNPEIMYVTEGNETESEYKIVFHSYTGALVNFYVNKTDGKTRIVEYVPSLDKEEESGTINIFDYLDN